MDQTPQRPRPEAPTRGPDADTPLPRANKWRGEYMCTGALTQNHEISKR